MASPLDVQAGAFVQALARPAPPALAAAPSPCVGLSASHISGASPGFRNAAVFVHRSALIVAVAIAGSRRRRRRWWGRAGGRRSRLAAGGGLLDWLFPASPPQPPPPSPPSWPEQLQVMNVTEAPQPAREPNKVVRSEQAWREDLGFDKYRILRRKGTEMPGTGAFHNFQPNGGFFKCSGCGLPLFSSSSKFESDCGWPVFDRVYYSEEQGCHVGVEADADGVRFEIVCKRCSGHLGHVGFQPGGSATGEIH
mmetsp:Transcript_63153/g.135606  ORF Transcript_63153/g.135606 Transcript_63153/m.135606 type:complete len:252 (+) Transcript_63153:49-804(+)